MNPISFKRNRFPPAIIRLGVWLYYRFTLSLRDVEELLAERGIDVTYENVCCWANKFGPAIAANFRRRRGRADSVWHLNEMVVRINGKRMYMWRAVDQEGEVLDVLVQKRRNKTAALKLVRKLLKNQGTAPEAIVTDGLKSYPAALKVLNCVDRHRPGPMTRQKPRREFAPSSPTKRAKNAAVQVSGSGSTLRFYAQRNLQFVQHPTSSRLAKHNVQIPIRRHGGIECCVRCCSMNFRARALARPAVN